jgi:hypothetical protein
MIESYRSYVIRVRRHTDDDAVRLDVEDLLGGRRAAVSGDEARVLAERLDSMIASGGDPRPVRPSATVPADTTPARQKIRGPASSP